MGQKGDLDVGEMLKMKGVVPYSPRWQKRLLEGIPYL
jgi:hypothetical protein